jgi:hypothetical protein
LHDQRFHHRWQIGKKLLLLHMQTSEIAWHLKKLIKGWEWLKW